MVVDRSEKGLAHFQSENSMPQQSNLNSAETRQIWKKRSLRVSKRYKNRRYGLASMDVVLMTGTLIPFCLSLYWLSQVCFSRLFSLLSIMIGSPIN